MDRTKDLGKIDEPILIFGGVYSNFQALEQMHEIALLEGFLPEQIFCTGDVVGYCANPEESVMFLKEWGVHCIAGNVELQLRDGEEDCGCDFSDGSRCDMFSRLWYPFAQSKLSSQSLDWMKQLPEFLSFEIGGKRATILHGSYHKTSEFIFESTTQKIKVKNFRDSHSEIIIAGHCGIPFLQEIEGKSWLNAGVIGMPANDATTRVWYAIMLPDGSARIHSFEYDHKTAAAEMRKNGLVESYAKTLETGLWDNCEILPEAETKAQGKRLEF